MAPDEINKKPRKRIGEYLTTDPAAIGRALTRQRDPGVDGKKKRLGELLLEDQGVDLIELDAALRSQRLDRLESCRLFAGVSVVELAEISNFVQEFSTEAGDEFIKQDTSGNCIYLLVYGRAQVFRRGDYGEETTLAFIEPGESIGEMGYFADGRRTASVRALEDSEFLQINYSDLEKILQAAPSLSKNFLDLITHRLRRTNMNFQEVTERSFMAEKSLEKLRRFLDLSEISNIRSGIEGLIERVVITASQVLDADRATLFLWDKFSGELWSEVAEGVEYREIRVPLGRGVAGWVAARGEMVNIPNAYLDDRFDKTIDEATGYSTRSLLCGPVRNLQGEIVGVIQVINKKTGAFGERDEALFKAFAYQTAVALENFRLYRKLINNHEQISILLDVANAVSQTLDLDALIVKIVNKTCEILEAERSTLFLLDRHRDELWSKVALGAELAEIRFPKLLGLAGFVAKTGQPLIVEDAYSDPRFNPAVDRETGYKTKNALSVPVFNRDGELIGVTQAINKNTGRFEAKDVQLLKAMSSQIAVALENAKLFRRTVNMKNYLTSVQESITNGILTLNNDFQVVTANKAALDLFQTRPEELLDHDFRDLIGPGNERLKHLVQRVLTARRSLVDYDLDFELPNREKHSVNVNLVPLLNPGEGYQGVVLIFDDITSEKRITGALLRYMAKDIVDRILEDPSQQALGGVQGKATALFADIRGFTGIAEGLTAEKTVEFLNEYFGLMVDVVFENGGVLDKFIGDAIMAVFGVPFTQRDDAERAVKTALDMKRVLAAFNARRNTQRLDSIRIGMGICTGNVVSGNIGSEKRMDYTVIGDGVNIASRLENLTKLYEVDILISDATRKEIEGKFSVRLVDQVLFRGKKRPVQVYEVLGDAGTPLSKAEAYFARGLELYRENDFVQAAKVFALGQDGDRLCRVFLKRCEHLIESPPAPDWDGVWVSDDK